jgi:hypothetical protein
MFFQRCKESFLIQINCPDLLWSMFYVRLIVSIPHVENSINPKGEEVNKKK